MSDRVSEVPSFDVAGKTVLITGGSGGIGFACGKAFHGLGARVTLLDMAPPPGGGDDGMAFETLDVRDDEAVAALAEKFDTVDVLVNCAGKLARYDEYKIDVFKDIVDIHLGGTFRLCSAFRPHLARSRGAVVNIGSMYSFFGSPQAPAYGSAKAAIVQLTKSLAIAWKDDGIRVNAIAPGWIKTEMTRRGREDDAFSAKVMARLPVGRWADPSEIAGPAVFLASQAASLVNGITLTVDGGYTAS